MNLTINDLSVDYHDNNHIISALDHVSFKLEAGKITALVGESGSGKTTIAMSCMGLLPETAEKTGEIRAGSLMLDELSKTEMNRIRWNTLAMVSQNGASNFNPVIPVIDQVAEPLVSRGTKKKEAKRKAAISLNRMGLEKKLHHHYAHQLSGGQIQRALIAMALILDPDILILDEPTASLDSLSKNFIKQIIREEAESGKAVLLITHDLGFAAELAKKTIVLYLGQLMEELSRGNIIDDSEHPYSKALARSFPAMDTTRELGGIRGEAFYRYTHRHKEGNHYHTHIEAKSQEGIRAQSETGKHVPVSGCIFRPRCTQAIPACSHAVTLSRKENGKIRCIRGGITTLVSFSAVSKNYSKIKALAPLDLDIKSGELFCLVGESGSGKTTLAMIGSGGIKPDSGKVTFNHEDIKEKTITEITGVVYQSPLEAVSHRLSVFEIVAEPLRILKTDKKQIRGKVIKALKRAQLGTSPGFLSRYPHELNMGAVQRVCIARAIVNEPLFLIADEPTSALDPSVQAKVLKMLLDLQTELGLTMLFITHNIGLARKIGDRVGVMLSGHMVEQGIAKQIFHSPRHPYTNLLLKDNFQASLINKGINGDDGCPFALNCSFAEQICFEKMPLKTVFGRGSVSCHQLELCLRQVGRRPNAGRLIPGIAKR